MKFWIILGIIAAIVLAFGLHFMSYYNTEVDYRTSLEAKQKDNTVVYDRVWKTISQQAGVAKEYESGFKDIYVDIMKAQNPDGQARLMKWVQQSNPQFDIKLFDQLNQSIASNRLAFEFTQRELIDRQREYNKLIQQGFGMIYLHLILGKKEIPIQLVTSDRTNKSFSTGVDNDTTLFGK